VELLDETGADNVGGTIDSIGGTGTASAIAMATSSPFGVGGSTFRVGRRAGWAQTVYPGTFKREVFDRVGLFDEELLRNQDDELNLRIIQSGGRIWFDPALRVEHIARASFASHFRQHLEFGLYKVRVMQKRRTVLALRHLVPAVFVIALVGSVLAALITQEGGLCLLVLGPYLIVAVVAAARATRGRPILLPKVLFAFFLMHIGYGVGTILGAWRWRRLFRHAGV
jgi:hypothetical protein